MGVLLWAVVTVAHFVMGTMAALVAQSSSGKPLDARAATVVGALVASNIAFTGIVCALLWPTDLRRSLPRVYLPLLAVLTLMAWVHPALWVLAAVSVYAALLLIARSTLDRDLVAHHSGSESCSSCGYDLEGINPDKTAVCPECAAPLPVAVRGHRFAYAHTREVR
jgi:hypothetical protein